VELSHHYEVLDLSAAERATYFELFQMLMNQPLKFSAKDQPESAKAQELDRTKRLQEMASASRSPEEALLICCSTSMSIVNGVEAHDRSASRVCKAILAEKKHHFSAEAQNLYNNLIEVFELWELGYRDIPENNPHFYSFIRSVANNTFGDMVSQAILDRVMGYAQAKAEVNVMQSKMIPPGARRLDVLVRAVWHTIPAADKKKIKAKNSKRTATKKVTQGESAEDQTEGDSSMQGPKAQKKGETKNSPPDLRDPAPRKAFMYGRAAVLTNLALRLVEHLRGLRFFAIIESYVNGGRHPKCSKCGRKEKHANKVLVMGLCGHASCIPCFEAQHTQRKLVDECVAEGCAAPAPRRSAFRLSYLNIATTHLPRPFGSKIDAVLKLLKDTKRVGTKDHVVIFVQFQRLKAALVKGLKDANITYLDGSHKHAVERFKNGAATVCILDPESVNAAGWYVFPDPYQ
jgi:hypothetical protein